MDSFCKDSMTESYIIIIYCLFNKSTEVHQGQTCKEFMGGGGMFAHSGPTFYKTDFAKASCHRGTYFYSYDWCSIFLSSLFILLYFYILIVFHTILAIKEATILGQEILISIEWQNSERSWGVGGMLPRKILDLWSSESCIPAFWHGSLSFFRVLQYLVIIWWFRQTSSVNVSCSYVVVLTSIYCSKNLCLSSLTC